MFNKASNSFRNSRSSSYWSSTFSNGRASLYTPLFLKYFSMVVGGTDSQATLALKIASKILISFTNSLTSFTSLTLALAKLSVCYVLSFYIFKEFKKSVKTYVVIQPHLLCLYVMCCSRSELYFGKLCGCLALHMIKSFSFSARALAHTSSETLSLETLTPDCPSFSPTKDLDGTPWKKIDVSSQL